MFNKLGDMIVVRDGKAVSTNNTVVKDNEYVYEWQWTDKDGAHGIACGVAGAYVTVKNGRAKQHG